MNTSNYNIHNSAYQLSIITIHTVTFPLPLFQPQVFTIRGPFSFKSTYLEKHFSIQVRYLVGSSAGVTPPKKQELSITNKY